MLALLLASFAAGTTISEAFPAPEGLTRVPPGAFAHWVQQKPVRPADEPVRTHAGRVVGHHARVIDMPLVPGDLQQCADSILRLRAEWLRDAGHPVSFHATSGDPLPWARFRDGETPTAPGNRIVWTPGSTGKWDDWLTLLFTWAGTASLEERDSQRASGTPQPGDLLVQGGFPGHAALIVDVATDGDRTAVLVAEGFMPAQSFHIELGPMAGWWLWEPGVDLGHWSFDATHLRRFSEPARL